MRNFTRILMNTNKILFVIESLKGTMMKNNGSCTQDTINIAESRNVYCQSCNFFCFVKELIQELGAINMCQNIKEVLKTIKRYPKKSSFNYHMDKAKDD